MGHFKRWHAFYHEVSEALPEIKDKLLALFYTYLIHHCEYDEVINHLLLVQPSAR